MFNLQFSLFIYNFIGIAVLNTLILNVIYFCIFKTDPGTKMIILIFHFSFNVMPSVLHKFHFSQRRFLFFFYFSEVPVSELSLELLLLQVVLPALLEQGHTRQWLKNVLRGWAVAAAFVL